MAVAFLTTCQTHLLSLIDKIVAALQGLIRQLGGDIMPP